MWNGEEFANVLLLMLMMLMMHYFVLFCLCVCALSHTSPYFTYELRNEGGGALVCASRIPALDVDMGLVVIRM